MDVMEKTESEKRLIDANAFLKDILTDGIGKTIIEYSESDIGYMIRKRPTVDAVEVVRCRECKHLNVLNRKELYAHCPKTNTVFLPFELDTREHFCSLGERKEDADNDT